MTTAQIAAIHLNRRVRQPRAAAWTAITDPEQVARWFAQVSLLGKVGDPYRIEFEDGSAVSGRVLAVDPRTLTTDQLIDYGPDTFGAATTALQVGREIWVGTARDQGLARFRFPNSRKN